VDRRQGISPNGDLHTAILIPDGDRDDVSSNVIAEQLFAFGSNCRQSFNVSDP
jgi:hypothetical protein